jgi:hypothetical protein
MGLGDPLRNEIGGAEESIESVRIDSRGAAVPLASHGHLLPSWPYQSTAENLESFLNRTVENEPASLLGRDEARLSENLEVMADSWLGHVKGLDQVACGTRLTRSTDETQQSEPGRVGEDAIPFGHPRRSLGIDRLLDNRSATLDDRLHHQRLSSQVPQRRT